MRILGIEPYLFDERKVPAALRPLLPYASLLAKGEEALWMEYWDALDREARIELWTVLRARIADLREFAEAPGSGVEWAALRDLRFMFAFLINWLNDGELATLKAPKA
jgi:hypothetical protein